MPCNKNEFKCELDKLILIIHSQNYFCMSLDEQYIKITFPGDFKTLLTLDDVTGCIPPLAATSEVGTEIILISMSYALNNVADFFKIFFDLGIIDDIPNISDEEVAAEQLPHDSDFISHDDMSSIFEEEVAAAGETFFKPSWRDACFGDPLAGYSGDDQSEALPSSQEAVTIPSPAQTVPTPTLSIKITSSTVLDTIAYLFQDPESKRMDIKKIQTNALILYCLCNENTESVFQFNAPWDALITHTPDATSNPDNTYQILNSIAQENSAKKIIILFAFSSKNKSEKDRALFYTLREASDKIPENITLYFCEYDLEERLGFYPIGAYGKSTILMNGKAPIISVLPIIQGSLDPSYKPEKINKTISYLGFTALSSYCTDDPRMRFTLTYSKPNKPEYVAMFTSRMSEFFAALSISATDAIFTTPKADSCIIKYNKKSAEKINKLTPGFFNAVQCIIAPYIAATNSRNMPLSNVFFSLLCAIIKEVVLLESAHPTPYPICPDHSSIELKKLSAADDHYFYKKLPESNLYELILGWAQSLEGLYYLSQLEQNDQKSWSEFMSGAKENITSNTAFSLYAISEYGTVIRCIKYNTKVILDFINSIQSFHALFSGLSNDLILRYLSKWKEIFTQLEGIVLKKNELITRLVSFNSQSIALSSLEGFSDEGTPIKYAINLINFIKQYLADTTSQKDQEFRNRLPKIIATLTNMCNKVLSTPHSIAATGRPAEEVSMTNSRKNSPIIAAYHTKEIKTVLFDYLSYFFNEQITQYCGTKVNPSKKEITDTFLSRIIDQSLNPTVFFSTYHYGNKEMALIQSKLVATEFSITTILAHEAAGYFANSQVIALDKPSKIASLFSPKTVTFRNFVSACETQLGCLAGAVLDRAILFFITLPHIHKIHEQSIKTMLESYKSSESNSSTHSLMRKIITHQEQFIDIIIRKEMEIYRLAMLTPISTALCNHIVNLKIQAENTITLLSHLKDFFNAGFKHDEKSRYTLANCMLQFPDLCDVVNHFITIITSAHSTDSRATLWRKAEPSKSTSHEEEDDDEAGFANTFG